MNKAVAAFTLLFIGAFLIYLGVFGTTGFGLRFALTSGFTDNFDDNVVNVGLWDLVRPTMTNGQPFSPLAIITETGGHARIGTTGISAQAYNGGFFITKNDFVCSDMEVSLDIIETSPTCAPVIVLQNEPYSASGPTLNDPVHRYQIALLWDSGVQGSLYIQYWDGTGLNPQVLLMVQNLGDVGQLKITIHTGTIRFYTDGTIRFTETFRLPSSNCYIWFGSRCPSTVSETVDFDNFALTLGGTSTTGTLNVVAYYNGQPVVASVTVNPGGLSGTTTTSGNPLSFTLNPGTYTVSGSYAGYSALTSATVSAGTTATATLTFTGGQQYGTVRVFAYYQGALVAVYVTLSGPSSSSGTTSININSPLIFASLPMGTYSVSGTYNGNAQSGAATLSTNGETKDITLTFGGSSENYGIIRVFAYYNSQPIAVSVTLTGAQTRSGTTTTSLTSPLRFELLPMGSYAVSGTYNSITRSGSTTLQINGETKDVTLDFGAPQPPTDPTAWLIALLNATSTKTIMLIVGISLAGAGGITLISVFAGNGKKRQIPIAYYR